MTRHGAAVANSTGTQFSTGVRWARSGWDEMRRNVPLWIGMSALYLIPAALLLRLPFAGALLVVLLSPMLLAGALLTAERHRNTSAGKPVDDWLKRPFTKLTSALTDSAHVYPAVLMGIVTLGLVVVVFIVEHLVGLTSLASLRGATLGPAQAASILIGVLIAGLLQVLLLMALFYAVHRTTFVGRDPLTAMGESFRACWRHPWAITGLTGMYLLPYLVILAGFSVSVLLGYLLLFTVGLVCLPAFVLASHASYCQLFPAPVTSE